MRLRNKVHRLARKYHKWLALVVGVQLLVWTATGLFFAIIPIEQIRSEHLVSNRDQVPLPASVIDSLSQELGLSKDALAGDVSQLRLQMLAGQPVLHIYKSESEDPGPVVVKLGSSADEATLPKDKVIDLASDDYAGDGNVKQATLIRQNPPIEYRGPLPVWQVVFSQPSGYAVYISPHTGRILGRRSNMWRVYDFLWALHIMDYSEREDFNHPLLILAAGLGVATSLTGLLLLPFVFKRKNKHRTRRKSQSKA